MSNVLFFCINSDFLACLGVHYAMFRIQLGSRSLSIDPTSCDFRTPLRAHYYLDFQYYPVDTQPKIHVPNQLQSCLRLGYVDRLSVRYRLHKLLVPGQLQN